MLRLVEVVGTSRALMAVCCSNAEVGYLASRTQCRHQVIGARATDGCSFLRQAGVRVGRANLGQRRLVGNRHLCSCHITVKRADDPSHQAITNQGPHVLCTDCRIMDAARTDIVFGIKNQGIARDHMLGIGLIDGQMRSILGRFAAACVLAAYGQIARYLNCCRTGSRGRTTCRCACTTGCKNGQQ